MKFFVTLMAFLVLALSCMPCADETYAKETSETATTIKASPLDNSDHEDACSPFCQCMCCAGFSMHHPAEADQPLPTQYANHCGTIYVGSIIEVSLPIWQPPQLS